MSYSLEDKTVYYYGDDKLEEITDLRSRRGKAQVYQDILSEHAGSNFVDPEFPHAEESIGNYDTLFDTADSGMMKSVTDWQNNGWNNKATWIRVGDLCNTLYNGDNAKVPCFNCGDVGKTIARNDIKQGTTGDCWFLCSVSGVSMVRELISVVIPSDNETNDEGVYHFRFWYQGAWVDVVVDDYIPCVVVVDKDNWTFTMGTNFHPTNGKAEFWPMLLEKAFAKLNGSYSNIASNVAMYALESLTGGFGVNYEMKDGAGVPQNMYQEIVKLFDWHVVIAAGSKTNQEQKTTGVVGNHAYSVTGAKVIRTHDGTDHNLIRLRNPWGDTEWKGNWSDSSSLWDDVSQSQKDDIDLVNKDDGEFWMSYNDFLEYYEDISGVFYFDLERETQYRFAQFASGWSNAQETAGGWEKPWNCPHFLVDMYYETGLLLVGTYVQGKLVSYHGDTVWFGIRVFPAGDETNFDEKFFEDRYDKEVFPAGKTKAPTCSMNSFSLIYPNLQAGKYVIVPSSVHAGDEGTLCVRILNEGNKPAVAVSNESRGGSRTPSPSGSRASSPAGSTSSN